MENQVYINGSFFPESQAKIGINEGGFLFGNGIFETMRTYSGNIFKLSEHLKRLLNSCRFLKIPLEETQEELEEKIKKSLKINQVFPAYLKVIVSSGQHGNSLTSVGSHPNLIIIVRKFTPYRRAFYQEGFTGIVVSLRRSSLSPVPLHKSLSFLENLLAKREAEGKGGQEAIFLNTEGNLAEGAISNIFLVSDEKVITPSLDSGILPGITRKVVLEICATLRIPSEQRKVELEELLHADEAFFTNSLMEIMPLTRVNSHHIGEGKPGRVTKRISQEYKKQTRAAALTRECKSS